jgi:hypothetical protein
MHGMVDDLEDDLETIETEVVDFDAPQTIE